MMLVRKIHKWASVLVGIQFLLWLLSGIYFNIMDHTKASGATYRSEHNMAVAVDNAKLVDPKAILEKLAPAISVTQTNLLGQPYYLLTHVKGLYRNFVNEYTLVDAYSGAVTNVDEGFANKLASKSYSGPGKIKSTTLITGVIDDFPKQKNATWQVDFADDINTSVYVEQGSGRIVGHSDDEKRFADIFFMLHFMDYGNEGSFNNVQIILFAFITLWLCLSGLIWTIDLGLRGQYQIKYFAKKKEVKLFDKHQKSLGSVALSTHTNLLDGLIEQNITLPSTCGGGGTCGRCKVMVSPIANATSADHVHFNDHEIQQGYRLACQHFCNDVEHMTLIDVTDAEKHTLELVKSRFVSPFIKELRFKVKGEAPFSFKAGAFMRFFIPDATGVSKPVDLPQALASHWQDIDDFTYEHGDCSRSYSFAESSKITDELVFTIKMQSAPKVDGNSKVLPGIGSNYLCNLAVGKTIEALGPFEDFFAQENSEKTMVLLGAGSGMAPLKAIIEEQMAMISASSEQAAANRNIHFFYGARVENDLLYVDEFYQLAEQNEHFHYYPTLSRKDEKWLGATGYVQEILALNLDNLIEQESGDITKIEFYLCGPQGLMSETIALLKSKGVADSAILFDEFI